MCDKRWRFNISEKFPDKAGRYEIVIEGVTKPMTLHFDGRGFWNGLLELRKIHKGLICWMNPLNHEII